MAALDALVYRLIDLAIEGERKAKGCTPLGMFRVVRSAQSLIEPAEKAGRHHRSRETYYTQELEKAEAEFREKGVSVEAMDTMKGYAVPMSNQGNYGVASGGIGNVGVQFQPHIDNTLLDNVRRAKDKMLEHRNQAEGYEKWARMFRLSPKEAMIELTMEDVFYFRLEQ